MLKTEVGRITAMRTLQIIAALLTALAAFVLPLLAWA